MHELCVCGATHSFRRCFRHGAVLLAASARGAHGLLLSWLGLDRRGKVPVRLCWPRSMAGHALCGLWSSRRTFPADVLLFPETVLQHPLYGAVPPMSHSLSGSGEPGGLELHLIRPLAAFGALPWLLLLVFGPLGPLPPRRLPARKRAGTMKRPSFRSSQLRVPLAWASPAAGLPAPSSIGFVLWSLVTCLLAPFWAVLPASRNLCGSTRSAA